jgi:ABC-type dipeptide/oligopeptide/nickel transport system permease component
VATDHQWTRLEAAPSSRDSAGYDASAFIARMVRSSVVEVLRQEYVLTARAKGLSERIVIFRHVLKAAMIPIITLVGLQAGRLLGGAVVVETVFARQGSDISRSTLSSTKTTSLFKGSFFSRL